MEKQEIFKPHPYQKRAAQWILDHPYCALFLDMGLGKTVITLTALYSLLSDGQITRTLVVAPKTVAETTWTTEAHKWAHLTGLRVAAAVGTAKQRERVLESDADVYVIGRDNITWLIETRPWRYDCLVLDELSSFKSYRAKRFKSLKSVQGRCRRIIGLTGTPAANGLEDLWAEMYLIDGGERLCRTVTGYRCMWFHAGAHKGSIVYEWIPNRGAREEIEKKLSDICLSMSAADYLTLPDCIYTDITVHMSRGERLQYDRMKRDRLIELEADDIAGITPATTLGKLLQMANGRCYTDSGAVMDLHSHKIDALKDIIDTAGEPVLVFYSYKHDLDAIKAAVPQAREFKGSEEIADWNTGKIPVLLAHPASCGMGLNLQAGGRIIVWYGLTWSLEQYQQANARLYRQGQGKPVLIYHIITAGTVDEQVLEALKSKDTTQKALLQALKAA